MKRLVLVPVVALVLAWQASQAMAVCAEGEALYFNWQDKVTAMNIAQINADSAQYALHRAQWELTEKQIEVSVHLAGHPECDANCIILQGLQDELTVLQQLVEDKSDQNFAAQYALDSAIATEQTAWWAVYVHFDWCPECD